MNSTASKDIFEDIKESAIMLWQSYDDTFGYASEKIARIEELSNTTIEDVEIGVTLMNWQVIVEMFDSHNQQQLIRMVSQDKTRRFLQDYYLEKAHAYYDRD